MRFDPVTEKFNAFPSDNKAVEEKPFVIGQQLVRPSHSGAQGVMPIKRPSTAATQQSEAIAAFIKFLSSPTAVAVIEAKGMQVD